MFFLFLRLSFLGLLLGPLGVTASDESRSTVTQSSGSLVSDVSVPHTGDSTDPDTGSTTSEMAPTAFNITGASSSLPLTFDSSAAGNVSNALDDLGGNLTTASNDRVTVSDTPTRIRVTAVTGRATASSKTDLPRIIVSSAQPPKAGSKSSIVYAIVAIAIVTILLILGFYCCSRTSSRKYSFDEQGSPNEEAEIPLSTVGQDRPLESTKDTTQVLTTFAATETNPAPKGSTSEKPLEDTKAETSGDDDSTSSVTNQTPAKKPGDVIVNVDDGGGDVSNKTSGETPGDPQNKNNNHTGETNAKGWEYTDGRMDASFTDVHLDVSQ